MTTEDRLALALFFFRFPVLSTGSAWHQLNQKALVERAFDVYGHPPDPRATLEAGAQSRGLAPPA